MKYASWELRTVKSPTKLSPGPICVREGQVNGIKMIVCVWGWVGVLSFGTRHAYNKPQMCRLSAQKCMQHISQFERGQNKTDPRDTKSRLRLALSLNWSCATSTPALNAWQLYQAVSQTAFPSPPHCHVTVEFWLMCARGVGSTLLQAARVRALRHVYCDFMCH